MFMGEWEREGWEQREKERRGEGKEGENEVCWFVKKSDCLISAWGL